jgi:very-short-patch-repair endonuclease
MNFGLIPPFLKGVGGFKRKKLAERLTYDSNLKSRAQTLRKDSTLAEVVLWDSCLKNRKLGYQFNRQLPIQSYIVDFACRKLKLIIEVDGYSHNFKIEKDKLRDETLLSLGYKVIRFTEKDIRYDLNNVIRALQKEIIEMEGKMKSPSPL